MYKFKPHQKSIYDKLLTNPNVLIVAPMGAGKTFATLVSTLSLVHGGRSDSAPNANTYNGIENVLIIAPKRVASSVWAQESDKLGVGLNISYCERSADIISSLLQPAHHRVVVCSVTRIHEIPNGEWDMVIIDESTLFGNKSSKRSKEIRRLCSGVKRRVLLTGTPIHGGYEKIWHQIFLLDGGKALGKSLTAFRSKYMRIKYQVHGVVTVYEMNPFMIDTLHADIRHLVHVVRDSVPMPPAMYKNVYVDLPAKRAIEYDRFERDSIIDFMAEGGKDPSKDSKTLASFAASSRGIKLRQLASGCVYVDENNTEYSVTHKEKIEAIKELHNSIDCPILLVYAFKSELRELKKVFSHARQLDTAKDIADWNAKKIPIALVHPASVGHGLNLQFGGHVLVWYSLTYDAELYAQTNKRLDRTGQENIVSVIHLIARGTMDEKVLKVLNKKAEIAEGFNHLI